MTVPEPGSDQPILDRSVLTQMAADVEPALMPQLIQAFMAEMRDREGRMVTQARADSLEAVRAEAHSLKSSAAAFGCLALSALCTDLDSRGKAADWAGLKRRTEALPAAIDAAEAALTAYLAESQA